MKNGSYDVAHYFWGLRELEITAGVREWSAVGEFIENDSKRLFLVLRDRIEEF